MICTFIGRSCQPGHECSLHTVKSLAVANETTYEHEPTWWEVLCFTILKMSAHAKCCINIWCRMRMKHWKDPNSAGFCTPPAHLWFSTFEQPAQWITSELYISLASAALVSPLYRRGARESSRNNPHSNYSSVLHQCCSWQNVYSSFECTDGTSGDWMPTLCYVWYVPTTGRNWNCISHFCNVPHLLRTVTVTYIFISLR